MRRQAAFISQALCCSLEIRSSSFIRTDLFSGERTTAATLAGTKAECSSARFFDLRFSASSRSTKTSIRSIFGMLRLPSLTQTRFDSGRLRSCDEWMLGVNLRQAATGRLLCNVPETSYDGRTLTFPEGVLLMPYRNLPSASRCRNSSADRVTDK